MQFPQLWHLLSGAAVLTGIPIPVIICAYLTCDSINSQQMSSPRHNETVHFHKVQKNDVRCLDKVISKYLSSPQKYLALEEMDGMI